MKKLIYSITFFCLALLLGGCSSSKQLVYFQNIDSVNFAGSRGLYDARIMPKDMLDIYVSTTNPLAAQPFTLSTYNYVPGSATGVASVSTNNVRSQDYLVDNNGDINFPTLGKIHVAGLTKDQCQNQIRDMIKPYLAESENPIVTVRMSSFRVTVTGEVGSPRVVPVTTEKMSIVEALAQAGDITAYGKRDNIILLREDADGQKEYHRLNMKDANIVNSPYYYLQQNDIIYVEPNKLKAQSATVGAATTLWASIIGTLLSLTITIISLTK